MTTRKSNLPTYVDLAKAGARIQRDIEPAVCTRLHAAVHKLSSVSAELSFTWDDQARIRVTGQASAALELDCQMCTEPVSIDLRADIAGVLARTETEAQLWREQESGLNIIMASSGELDELELVEDELLLRLPTRVCVDAACDRRPSLVYPAAADAEEQNDRQRPFAALAQLKSGRDAVE